MDRYLHMLSWGVMYSIFSFIIIYIYNILEKRYSSIKLRIQGNDIICIHISDLVIFLILTIFSSIRLNTGSDFYNYYIYFNTIKERYISLYSIVQESQMGYFALSWIIRSITDFEFAIFAVVAFFSYAHLFYVLRKEKISNVNAALICYMFLGYFAYSNNILKQYVAMCFLMNSYFCLVDRKYIKFTFFSLAAIIFHYSAFIAIISFFVFRKIQPSYYKLIISLAVGFLISIFLNEIILLFTNIFASSAGYEKYLNWRRSDHFRLIAAVYGMFCVYLYLTYYMLKYKKEIKEISVKRYNEMFFVIVGLGINLIALNQWIINRVAIYFYQFIILLLPSLITVLEQKKKKNTKFCIYFVMVVYMLFSSVFLGENEYFSYNTIFSDTPVMSDIEYNAIHGWYKQK